MTGLPVQRACRAVGLGRATYYRPLLEWAPHDAPVIAALTSVGAVHPRWGFWKCYRRLRLDGHPWNANCVWRVSCDLRLNLPRRTKKRLPVRLAQPLPVVPAPTVVWAVDFMSDTWYGGRRFRTLNILDEGVREGLAIEVDTSLPAERVRSWCAERSIALRYIQPGKPAQNGIIERFNRTEVLNAYVFESLEQVRESSAAWLQRYNEERPHDALAGVPPTTYRAQVDAKSSP